MLHHRANRPWNCASVTGARPPQQASDADGPGGNQRCSCSFKAGRLFCLCAFVYAAISAQATAWPDLHGRRSLAQTTPLSADYYAALKTRNLSYLWCAAQRMHPDKQYSQGKAFGMPDPIGFIGPIYQRFCLHYTSIRQDATNPYVYRVAVLAALTAMATSSRGYRRFLTRRFSCGGAGQPLLSVRLAIYLPHRLSFPCHFACCSSFYSWFIRAPSR